MRKQPVACDQCGRMTQLVYNIEGKLLCSKHYHQFKKYGKFLDSNPRTTFDPNQIDIDEENGIAKIHLYNRQCEDIGTAIIDLEDLPLVKDIKWKLSNSGYAQNTPGRGKSENKSMHREILGLSSNDPRPVDHKDHDKLNNRRSNLRIITKSKNAMNMETKGVYQHGNRWEARIKLNQISLVLGYFHEEDFARYARWYAETLVFRNFRYDKSEPNIDPVAKECIKDLVYYKISNKRNEWDKICLYNAPDNIIPYLPDSIIPISIDPIITRKNARIKIYNRLIPDYDKYNLWSSNKADLNFHLYYVERILTPLDQDNVIQDLAKLSGGKNVVLITKHKNKTTVDHRYLVMRWFEKYAIPCPELTKGKIQDIIENEEEESTQLLDVV